jgi:hypothetical protein
MDVAVYIKKSENEPSERELLEWLQKQLQEAYKNKNIKPEQITVNDHCVTIAFAGSGLKVDVSPVICDDATTDYGYLINKNSGKRVLTNIPLHLKFIRDRKKKQPHNYRQVIRLIKWWAKNIKNNEQDYPNFRFKSFLGELICAHLADNGQSMKDYITALEKFFAFIIQTGLKQRISFTDNYSKDKLPVPTGSALEVFDPVNPTNNIVARYSEINRLAIVEAAQDAFDALSEAQYATTKERAIECWRKIFGSSFNF